MQKLFDTRKESLETHREAERVKKFLKQRLHMRTSFRRGRDSEASSCTWDMFTFLNRKSLLSDVPWTVKPEFCMCSEGLVLQQNRWDNVAEYS